MRILTMLALFGAIAGGCAAGVQAHEPQVSVVQPTGFQRGTEVEVNISGARLQDVEEILFYSPGFQVTQLEAVDANRFKAQVAVAPDCRLGIHALRVRTATGLSDLRTFTVGALPEVAEQEPNSEFGTPQSISPGVTVTGVVENEDVDYFVVEAKKGERLTAELEGIRLGYAFFDPYVAILNEKRFELTRSDDAALLRQDCLCSIVVPEDGKYIIEVRESAYGGAGNCFYRLHVGRFPRPIAVYPAGGRPGESLTLSYLDASGAEWQRAVTLPSDSQGASDLYAEDEQGVSPSPNSVRVVDLPNALEVEPNNAREQATPGEAPGAFNGRIQEPGDVDHFRFAAKKGQVFDIRVYARDVLRSPLDAVLVVRRANGQAVGSNDDSGGPDAYYRFTAPEDEEYFVEVTDHLRSGGPEYVYRVELTPVAPALTMVVPERFRYVSTVLQVPKGNRMALMINASRANFGGEIKLDLPELPPGMTFQAAPMSANESSIPVLFTAAADAGTAGSLTRLIGRCENPAVVGELNQRTMLVRGQNNRDVWGHDAQRLATAITAEAPFTLEIVQPQVPIVRNGNMALKVVAKRQEGFNAAIAVSLLYNPPGISSSGSISIPEGQSEVTIPLTANGNAPVQTWPIAVIGRAGTPTGAVEVSTQMADLAVSEPFFSFSFEKSAVEQGQETEVLVKVAQNLPFEGEATVELLGLPAKTAFIGDPVTFNKDAEALLFKVKAEADSRPGKYQSLVCRAIVTQNGEPITHTMGTGELRIDEPLPPKADAPPQPQPEAKPAEPPKPAEKRLSRLEQLRLEREKARKDNEQP